MAPRACVLRTSWVVGAHGSNFLKTMLRLAGEKTELRVVADQIGVPTSTQLLTHVTHRVLQQMAGADMSDPRWGIYHLAPKGETSWHTYAQHIIEGARQRGAPLKLDTASHFVLCFIKALFSPLNLSHLLACFL